MGNGTGIDRGINRIEETERLTSGIAATLQRVYGDVTQTPLDRQAAREVYRYLTEQFMVPPSTLAAVVEAAGGRVEVPDHAIHESPELVVSQALDPPGLVLRARVAHAPQQIERESVEDARENDRCGDCGSPAHFVEDCPTRAILSEVADERREQDKQWGEQNHPQADPVILARLAAGTHPGDVARRLAEEYEVPTAVRARFICENEKPTTWFGIALEEFCEVLDAIATGNPARAREEWIQLSAVSAAAAESLDRNEGRQVGKGEQG